MAITLLMFAVGSFVVTSAIGLAATSDEPAPARAVKDHAVNAAGYEHAHAAMRGRLGG